MALQDHSAGEKRLELSELARPVLALAAVAAAVATAASLLASGGRVADPFDLRLALLFIACTASIIVGQAFFAQYFAVKGEKQALLADLEREQALDLQLLEALSARTGVPATSPERLADEP